MRKPVMGESGNVSVVRDQTLLVQQSKQGLATDKLPPHYNLQGLCPNKKALSCPRISCFLCLPSLYYEILSESISFVF